MLELVLFLEKIKVYILKKNPCQIIKKKNFY